MYVHRSLRDAAPSDAFASIEKDQLDSLERNAVRTALDELDALLAEGGDRRGARAPR